MTDYERQAIHEAGIATDDLASKIVKNRLQENNNDSIMINLKLLVVSTRMSLLAVELRRLADDADSGS